MQTKRPVAALSCLAGTVLLATTLVGCGGTPAKDPVGASSQQPSSAATHGSTKMVTSGSTSGDGSPASVPVKLTPSVKDGATGVKVSTLVSVRASAGTVTKVNLVTKSKDAQGTSTTVSVAGQVSPDGSAWTATSALDPGATYQLKMQGENTAGNSVEKQHTSFTTQKLSLHDQVYSTIVPAKGSTVGIGMPVILTFDLPVKNRKAFEKHLSVTSTGNQPGSWHWYGDRVVHFRPENYWQPGTKVTATANLNGVSAGGGFYGQNSASTSFTVGTSVITNVNLKTDQAKVYVNGHLARRIPVSGGKAGWRSRSGTKLIMQKIRMTRMTNEAIGAKEHYDFQVPFAMRVTNSGEFLHAAPWKEGKGIFGVSNTSHGCIGMSTANARWLFGVVKLGDPVVTTGTNRGLEQGNGWSDWNISYKEYQQGSAL